MPDRPTKYAITLSKLARKALAEDLPLRIVEAVMAFIEGPLAENPYRVGKQLNEPLFPMYSARRGEYRILYFIDQDQVFVEIVKIEHRSVVYRNFKPGKPGNKQV
jgi:mRNA interferase RelE/StbE